MGLVTVDLDCTAVGTPSATTNPQINLQATATNSTVVRKLPQRTLSSLGTASLRLLKLPQKVFLRTALSTPVISAIVFGIDTFDVVAAKVNWFTTQFGTWSVKFVNRFGFSVKGKPGG